MPGQAMPSLALKLTSQSLVVAVYGGSTGSEVALTVVVLEAVSGKVLHTTVRGRRGGDGGSTTV